MITRNKIENLSNSQSQFDTFAACLDVQGTTTQPEKMEPKR